MGRRMKLRRPGLWLFAALVLALGATPLLAAERRTGEQVIIGADEVVRDNLYAAAESIRIDGVVEGDVVAVGNVVTVNGTITGDLMAAANTVIVNGQVADVRAAGAAVQLGPQAALSGDLLAGGGSLELQRGSAVGKDMLFGAGQALIDGAVARDLTGGAGRLQLRGVIGGDANIDVGGSDEVGFMPPVASNVAVSVPQVPPGFTLGEGARVDGTLRYRSTTAATIDSAAQVGEVNATVAPAAAPARVNPFWGWLRHLAALAVIGLLLIWLLPAWTRRMADEIEAAPVTTLGWGLLAMGVWILAMIVVVLATIAVAVLAGVLTLGRLVGLAIGLGLLLEGALTAGLLVYVGYVAQAIVALLVGRLLLARFAPAWNERLFAPLLLGLVLYIALTALPFVGWLVSLGVALLGLGALWAWAWPKLRPAQPAAPAPRAAAGLA
jgi:cytoskeletal protein CcmA (bactofilin family)